MGDEVELLILFILYVCGFLVILGRDEAPVVDAFSLDSDVRAVLFILEAVFWPLVLTVLCLLISLACVLIPILYLSSNLSRLLSRFPVGLRKIFQSVK